MENNLQYYFGKSSTLNIGGTLISTGRYPIESWRQWNTLSDLENFIIDVSPSAAAFPGMLVSVVKDNDIKKNGVYFILAVGEDAFDENDNTKCSKNAYVRLVLEGEYGKIAYGEEEETTDGITNVTELQKILNELKENIEDMDYVHSVGLTDLDYRLNHVGDEIDKREEIYAHVMTDLNDRINNLKDDISSMDEQISSVNTSDEILSAALFKLKQDIIDNEKTTARAISFLNDKLELITGSDFGSDIKLTYGVFPDGEHQKISGIASVDDTIDYVAYYLGGQKGIFSDGSDAAVSGWADVVEVETFVKSVENGILSTISTNELISASAFNDLNNKIFDLESIIVDDELFTSTALNDMNTRLLDLEPYVIKQDANGNIKTKGIEDSNYIGSTEDIALGVGVFADKRRSFGWGNSYQGLFLTGSNSQYVVTFQNADSVLGGNNVMEIFSIACIGGHILASGDTHQRVASIVNAIYDSSTPSVTIETDVDLGELNNQKFTYESKTGEMNFCAGNFMVSGRQNVVLGTSQFVSQGLSVSIGLMNAQGGLNGTVIGCHNKNKVTSGVILGVGNVLEGKAHAGTFGSYNKVTSNDDIPGYAIGNDNIISSGYGTAIGDSNTISTRLGYVIGAANEILYPGVALGFYSKNYTSSSNAEKNIFVVGAGSNANNRKNSIEQKYNGDLYVAGLGSFDGTNSSSNNVDSLQEVITKLAARIEALETLHANE